MNVKPGDLAYIVAGPFGKSANEGRVVEVISVHRSDQQWGVMWRCGSVSPVLTYKFDRKDVPANVFECADDWLRPISGVPVEDEVTDDLKEPA